MSNNLPYKIGASNFHITIVLLMIFFFTPAQAQEFAGDKRLKGLDLSTAKKTTLSPDTRLATGKTIGTTNGCGSADLSASNHQFVALQTGAYHFVRKRFIAVRVFELTWCSMPSLSISAVCVSTPMATKKSRTISWRCLVYFAIFAPCLVSEMGR